MFNMNKISGDDDWTVAFWDNRSVSALRYPQLSAAPADHGTGDS